MILFPRNPAENAHLCEWAARKIGQDSFERAQSVGILRNGEIVAVVGLHDHSHPNVMLSWAGEGRWLTRKLLWVVFDWAFNQLKVNRIRVWSKSPTRRHGS